MRRRFSRRRGTLLLVLCAGFLCAGLGGVYMRALAASKNHARLVGYDATYDDSLQPKSEGITTPIPSTPTPQVSNTPNPPTSTPVRASQKMQAKVLMYHYVRTVDEKSDPLGYRLSVHPDELDRHITFLQSRGYHPISMADLMAGKGDDHAVVMTFDDGYEDFYTAAYPILKKHGWTATVYVITNDIGGQYLTWDQIKQLDAEGFEIGAHTVSHKNLATLSETDQKSQIFDSKKTLESELGHQVTTFAYPSGKYNDISVRLVHEAGFTSAVTTQPGTVTPDSSPMLLKRYRMNPDMTDTMLGHDFP